MRRYAGAIGALLIGGALLWWWTRPTPATVGAAPDLGGAGSETARRAHRAAPERAPVRLSPATRSDSPGAAAGAIEGRVVSSANGLGVAGASLTFLHAGVAIAVDAGADGAFLFAPGEPGRYELAQVAARGFVPFAPELGQSPVSITVRPALRISDVLLYLDPIGNLAEQKEDSADGGHAEERAAGGGNRDLGPPGTLRGVVRDAATGRPVPGFVVELLLRRGPLERATATTRTVFDAEGRYELEGIAPGAYAVTAVARGFAPAPEVRVTIAAGEVATADLALPAGARLRGRVVEAAGGGPIAGAHVSLEGALDGDGVVPLATSATTGGDGSFSIGGLGVGLRSILVTAEKHHGRILSGLSIDGPELAPITVALDKTEPGEEPRIELVGIGAVLSGRGDALLIGQVLPGGGAAEAGIIPGDGILAVDGVPVVELGFPESIQHIRGPEASVVRLLVRRGGDGGASMELAVNRRRIRN